MGRDKKNWHKIYNFYFNICEKLSLIDAVRDFSVWLITGSNPADINRFQSHTGNYIISQIFLHSYKKIIVIN